MPQPVLSVRFRFSTFRSSPMDFDTKSSSKQDGAKERVDAEALLAGAVERVFRLRAALKETEAEAKRIRENLRAELMITKGDTADFEIDGKICELVTSDVIGFVNQTMPTKHVATIPTGATSDDRAVGASQKNLESQANMQVDMKVEKSSSSVKKSIAACSTEVLSAEPDATLRRRHLARVPVNYPPDWERLPYVAGRQKPKRACVGCWWDFQNWEGHRRHEIRYCLRQNRDI